MRLEGCIALLGAELEPHRCDAIEVESGHFAAVRNPVPIGPADCHGGGFVVIPGLINGHTHLGDAFLPDGSTGMTLEEAFFRPNGFKYREVSKVPRDEHIQHLEETLRFMAATGTIAHIDFREQGVEGAKRLRCASDAVGVRSIILSQFDEVPFDEASLKRNVAPLPNGSRVELEAMLAEADGFSESTMNDLTDSAWREVRTISNRFGKARAIHCLENAGYRTVSLERTGRGDLERAIDLCDPDLIVHLTVADDVEIEMLAKSKITAVINPRANAVLGLPLPPIAALLEAGVNLLLGTDNGMLNSPNLLAEADFTYKLAKSQYGDAMRPAPTDILKMMTSNLGKTRWARVLPGVIGEGAPANFAVLDFSAPHLRSTRHLIASILTRTTPADVVLTVRDGQVIHSSTNSPIQP